MIPKVIHYCWFGNNEMSPFIRKCVGTWQKVMPDYQLRCWTEKDIQPLIENISFVRDAYNAKKWAFVADYVRLYALYTEGGIYMDTDIKVVRSFDEFLSYSFFSSHEKHPVFFTIAEQAKINEKGTLKKQNDFVKGMGILSAVMGSEKGLPYIKDCIDYYNNLTFDVVNNNIVEYVIGKHITRIAANKYGYLYKDEEQHLMDNMCIMKSDVFVGNMIYYHKGNEYAIHLCNGSWVDDNKTFIWKLRNNSPKLYALIGPIYTIILKIWNRLQK